MLKYSGTRVWMELVQRPLVAFVKSVVVLFHLVAVVAEECLERLAGSARKKINMRNLELKRGLQTNIANEWLLKWTGGEVCQEEMIVERQRNASTKLTSSTFNKQCHDN